LPFWKKTVCRADLPGSLICKDYTRYKCKYIYIATLLALTGD
jgi:hypothetical protein